MTDDPADTSARTEDPHHLERSVRVGILWKFVGLVGVQGTRFVTVAILARLLDPAEYGAAADAIALASFASTLGDMGMGSALVQTDRATRVVRSTVFWGSLSFGVLLSALIVVAAYPVGWFLDDPHIGALMSVGGLTFAIYALSSSSQAMYLRAMNFRSVELRYILALVIAGIVSIAAASAGAGSWALVVQQVALASAFALALWWQAGWRPTLEFSGPEFRKLSRFALRIAGGRWARLGELLLLTLLIGKLVGIAELGAWTFAMSAVILPLTVIVIPIAEVLFAAFSRMRGQRERIAALWIDSIAILAAVVLPLLAGLAVLAPDLIPLVFGAQWEVSVPIIQILSVYALIRSLQSWNAVILDAAGRPQITMWTQLTALVVSPVTVVITAQWGMEAVAVGFVLSQLIAVELPLFYFVLSELRLTATRIALRLAGVAAATLVLTGLCFSARLGLEAAGTGAGPRVVASFAVGVSGYAAALWLLAPDLRDRAIRLLRTGYYRYRVLSVAAKRGE